MPPTPVTDVGLQLCIVLYLARNVIAERTSCLFHTVLMGITYYRLCEVSEKNTLYGIGDLFIFIQLTLFSSYLFYGTTVSADLPLIRFTHNGIGYASSANLVQSPIGVSGNNFRRSSRYGLRIPPGFVYLMRILPH